MILVRYCPECGHIGPVPETAIACCPDSHPADVPETFIEVLQRANTVIDSMLKGHERLLAEMTLRAVRAEDRAARLTVLILKVLERWWPFIHGSIGASTTAKNLRKELADATQPEGVPKFDGCL